MAEDSTPADPLLCSFADLESGTPVIGKSNKPTSLDDVIEHCIGELRWIQIFQSLLVSCAWIFDAQQCFISIFTDSDTGAGDVLPGTSIISDFSLQNASSLVTGLPASSFFIGCLAGGILLTTLADSSMGRKNMLFISCLFTSLFGLLTIVSTNIWCYSVFRFLCGFFRSTIGTCALVLATELVGKRWRGQVGIVGFLCFTTGFLSLPAIAYINRGSSWRVLYLWTCIPNLFYCLLIHFMLHESPRWLFVRGRKDEFIASLKSLAPTSYGITSSFFSSVTFEEEEPNVDVYSAMKILFAKPWAMKRILAVMASGFGIGMVYYGMPLGIGNLGFNVYLGVTLDALVELPSSLAAFFLIGKIKRKGSLIFFTALGGLTSIGCVAIELIFGENNGDKHTLKMAMQLASFFCSNTAFDVLLIYTMELFPTCVRNSAVSLVRQALVFAGVFSPVLVAAGRNDGGFISYGVFGIAIGICGIFAVWLPETRGEAICDTMDEEERKCAIY